MTETYILGCINDFNKPTIVWSFVQVYNGNPVAFFKIKVERQEIKFIDSELVKVWTI